MPPPPGICSPQLLPERERVLGPEHPETLTTRQNLAHWTEQAEHGNEQA